MRVVYQTIANQISDAIFEADKAGRKIDRIEVSVMEANVLEREVFAHLFNPNRVHRYWTSADHGKKVGNFHGVLIFVEAAP